MEQWGGIAEERSWLGLQGGLQCAASCGCPSTALSPHNKAPTSRAAGSSTAAARLGEGPVVVAPAVEAGTGRGAGSAAGREGACRGVGRSR